MVPHLLLAITAGFGVGEKAKALLQPYPQLRELVEVKVNASDGREYLLKLWEGIQRRLGLWEVKLRIGGRSMMEGEVVEIDSLILEGEFRFIESVLKHEVAHVVALRKYMGGGENLPIVVELAATDTLFERETDARFLLPLLLPYIRRVNPTLGGHSRTLWKLSLSENVDKTFELLLQSLAPPEEFQCGKAEGIQCFRMIKKALVEAYKRSNQKGKVDLMEFEREVYRTLPRLK